MARRKTPEPRIVTRDGREIVRRYQTLYWFDARMKEPSRWANGFPRTEDGSIEGAARTVMRGIAARVQCIDRVTGRVLWTVERGARVPGTHLFQTIPHAGDSIKTKGKDEK